MFKCGFTTGMVLAGLAVAHAQNWQSQWLPEPMPGEANDVLRWVKDYRTFTLRDSSLEDLLNQAPREIEGIANPVGIIIALPMPDGSRQRFRIWENNLMGPQVRAQVPWFRTFSGQGIDDPNAILRADFGKGRFSAMVLGSNGNFYIEPLYKNTGDAYFVYQDTDSMMCPDWQCHVQAPANAPLFVPQEANGQASSRASGTQLYTFRLAVNGTVEYTAARGGAANAPASVAATVNRVDGIYRRDLAIAFNLVWVRTWAAEPDGFTNTSNSAALNENGPVLNNTSTLGASSGPGVSAYDLGHVFTTTGGGVAYLASVGNNLKAGAVSGLSTPTGDAFDLIVAHEIGHQFDGYHAFNATSGGCGSNRMWQGSFEPGSGMSIMSYAGRCSPENYEADLRPFFHSGTISRMLAYRNSIANIAVITATGNNLPTINAGANFTIPQATPFRLSAVGNDVDGDSLTYSFDQINLPASSSTIHAGPTTVTTTNTSRPLFRPFLPGTANVQFFPSQSLILANNYTNTYEFLPNVDRSMTFRATARDNRSPVGGVNEDDVIITVAGAPFRVTSPNTAVTLNSNQTHTLTWTPGGGSVSPTVNIRLSTNGGSSYFNNTSTLVLAGTPNDGSQVVTLPAVSTTSARLFIEAANGTFFDLSDSNFTIQTTNRAPVITNPGTFNIAEEAAWTITPTVDHPDNLQTLTWSFVGTPPAGLTINPTTGQLNWTPSEAQGAGSYSVTIRAADNGSPVASDQETFTINVSEVQKLVSGTVALQGFLPGATGQNATVRILPVGGTTPVQSFPVTLGAGGSYSVNATVAPGTYDIQLDRVGNLSRRQSSVTITPIGATVANLVLPGGDTNDDGEVDAADIDVVILSFGGADPIADVDGSGEVDAADIDLIIGNFGLTDQ